MRIMTVLGTRPEIIRLSLVIRMLDELVDQHVVVHTGQNYVDRLDAIFFRELEVRAPDLHLGVRGANFAEQVAKIFVGISEALLAHRPDRLLILGDTNSGLSAVIARRFGIPVYHMEAGNRCFDDRVPEEVNRRVIDHSSSVLLPYTERSRDNLLREGIEHNRIYVTGNPIKQVIDHFADRIESSTALQDLELEADRYFLVTLHRAENVDRADRLRAVLAALGDLYEDHGFPVICSLHPRTRARADQFGIDLDIRGVRFLEPLGFFDFVQLERSAYCLLSDSGTVQEEACIFGVPNVTLRDVTERPETVECGSNILAGVEPDRVRRAVAFVTSRSRTWNPPPEYLQPQVAETVCRIVTAYRPPDAAELEWLQGQRT
jgi:UDP-N-acetylglucosamine 2-epimerase (non-hydrolysing)